MSLSKLAPFIFDDHEADAADCCGIQLCVMEPAVHVNISIVVECPFRTVCRADIDCNEVCAQSNRKSNKAGDSAEFCSACKLICKNKPGKDQQPAEQLIAGRLSVNFKKHKTHSCRKKIIQFVFSILQQVL